MKLVNTYCQKLHHYSVKKKIPHILPPFSLFYTCLRNRKDLDSHLLGQRGEIITLALIYVAMPNAICGEPYCCVVILYFWNGQYIEEGQNCLPEAEIKSAFLRPFP